MADVKSTPSLTAPASQLSSTTVTSLSTSAAPTSQSSSADSTSQTSSEASVSIPPLIHLKDADVEISILPGAKNDFFLPSTLLKSASPYFAARLSDNWIEGTLTGRTTVLSDGTVSPIKRFELVFNDDGSHIVAKPSVDSPYKRMAAALETIKSSEYRSAVKKSSCHILRNAQYRGRACGSPMPDAQWKTTIAINMLGLAMLCRLPLDHKVIFDHVQHIKSMIDLQSMTCFVYRMVEWIDFYGVLGYVCEKFRGLIRSIVPEVEVRRFPLAYLRLASLLRDLELFAIPLNNEFLLGGVEKLVSSESLNARLGLTSWLIGCQRSIGGLHNLSWELMKIPNNPDNVSASAEARRTARRHWIDRMLYEHDHSSVDHPLIQSSDGMLNLPLAVLFDRNNALMGNFASVAPRYFTPDEILETEALLRSWMSSAQSLTGEHLILTASPYGYNNFDFQINAEKILQHSGYPWQYRDTASESSAQDDVILQDIVMGHLEGHNDDPTDRTW